MRRVSKSKGLVLVVLVIPMVEACAVWAHHCVQSGSAASSISFLVDHGSDDHVREFLKTQYIISVLDDASRKTYKREVSLGVYPEYR